MFCGVSTSCRTGLPSIKISTLPCTSAEPFSVASSSARSAMMVACVVLHAPLEFFFEAM